MANICQGKLRFLLNNVTQSAPQQCYPQLTYNGYEARPSNNFRASYGRHHRIRGNNNDCGDATFMPTRIHPESEVESASRKRLDSDNADKTGLSAPKRQNTNGFITINK